MKNQRIPEHKLNTTTTVGQTIENMTSKKFLEGSNSEKIENQVSNKRK
ncbi:hypothetical protein V7152_19060 [Neobacillus drentensis]|jgi:hypothetical protein